MGLMDRWITLTLTNQTCVSALTAGLLGSAEAMKTFGGVVGWLWRKGVKQRNVCGKGTREKRGTKASIRTSPSPHPLAIKDLREVLMSRRPQAHLSHSLMFASLSLPLLSIFRTEEEREMLAYFACSPSFIRSDAASALLEAR